MLEFAVLRPGAGVPQRANPWDAGLDLAAMDAAEIAPGARAAIGTGLAVAIPRGHAGLVLPRSGLARDHGITVANAPGLIDAGYRGELTVLLVNLGDAPHAIAVGERIAQLVVVPVGEHRPVEVAELPPSDGRGGGGFGSTGRG